MFYQPTFQSSTGQMRPMRMTGFSPSVQRVRYNSSQAHNVYFNSIITNALQTTEAMEAAPEEQNQKDELAYIEPETLQNGAITNLKLFFALPWRRFKSGSVLTIKLSGKISEQPQGRFSNVVALPDLTLSLMKAALDPRIKGVCVKIDPLQCGWSKVQEIKRHVEFFRKSGKFSMAYIERAGEKEMYLATGFEEIYAPPSASISIRGISVKGTFLRGVLDKIGVEPEIRRIGNYKSAGDQLLRSDMSEYQREQLTTLLEDIYDDFVESLATSRGKTKEEIMDFIDEGVFDMQRFKEVGLLTDLLYEDQINDLLKERTDGKEDELRFVRFKRYKNVSPKAFGFGGKKTVAIIRTSGAIVGGEGRGGVITADKLIAQLRALKKNKRIAAVVLRVDSPGGDALASDLMWREIQKFAEEKPIIASMSDVAASGGYYMSMACQKIVAESLTITGSIGVVTGKFSLAELYRKAGYGSETISKGKYAEILNESRPFNDFEADLFDKSAQHAYEQFRNKAASSRNMEIEEMQKIAQGRVWTGKQAVEIGLVDEIGGLHKAVQLAKEAANITERVTLKEVSRSSSSPLTLLTGGAFLQAILAMTSMQSNSLTEVISQIVGIQCFNDAMKNGLDISESDLNLVSGVRQGVVMAQLPDCDIEGSFSMNLQNNFYPSGDNSSIF